MYIVCWRYIGDLVIYTLLLVLAWWPYNERGVIAEMNQLLNVASALDIRVDVVVIM